MRPPARRHSLEQIIEAGRWAWASSSDDDVPDFCYDGAVFWHQPEGQVRRSVIAEALPKDGWWHAKDCMCQLCRPSRSR